jgi:hypothetical protein
MKDFISFLIDKIILFRHLIMSYCLNDAIMNGRKEHGHVQAENRSAISRIKKLDTLYSFFFYQNSIINRGTDLLL